MCIYDYAGVDSSTWWDNETFEPNPHLDSAYRHWDRPRVHVEPWRLDFFEGPIPGDEEPRDEDHEERNRRCARYLLLTRPWEQKPGVTFKATCWNRLDGKADNGIAIPPPTWPGKLPVPRIAEDSHEKSKAPEVQYTSHEDA